MRLPAAPEGLLLSRWHGSLGAVETGNRVHLVLSQLLGDRAHLLIDIVLAHALGKSRELAFNISGVLAPERRSAELVGAKAMTGCARWDFAPRIAGKDQADSGIVLPQAAPALGKAFAGYRWQSVCTTGEIGRHVS
jgi:hypothetical protein